MAENAHHQRHTTTPRQRVWVFAFLGAAVLLLGGTLILATGRSRIAFTWTPQPVHTTAAITLAAEPTGDEIATTVIETSVDVRRTFTATATTDETPKATPAFTGRARGRATITNRWSKVQPLQAGTRLQSADGHIFRTQQRVDVAAGSSVTTLVIADVAGQGAAVKKGTTFTLPALWAGLQDDITGVAAEDFYGEAATPGSTTQPGLTANELANAEAALLEEAADQAQAPLAMLVPEGKVLYPGLTSTNVTKRTGPSIGEQRQSYELALTVRVIGFTVEAAAMTNLGETLLDATLAQDVQLLALDPTSFTYTVERYDAKTKKVTGSLEAKGTTAPAPNHHLLQHATYAGKSATDVRALLAAESAVSNVAVELSPFWTRRVPAAAENLEIAVTRSQ